MVIDGKSYEAYVYEGEDEWQVLLLGQQYPVQVEDEREKRLRAAAGGRRGGVGRIPSEGTHARAGRLGGGGAGSAGCQGAVLVILESMKMQNELKAPRAGTVTRVKVKAGETVEQRQTLVTIG